MNSVGWGAGWLSEQIWDKGSFQLMKGLNIKWASYVQVYFYVCTELVWLLNDVYVCCLCLQERMLSQTGVNARSRDLFGLRCLPGKIMLLQTDFVVMSKDIIEIVTTVDGKVIWFDFQLGFLLFYKNKHCINFPCLVLFYKADALFSFANVFGSWIKHGGGGDPCV